jgi:hypothetical protein
MSNELTYTAFLGHSKLVSGSLAEVLRSLKSRSEENRAILVFEDQTGRQVDFDLRGAVEEVLARHCPEAPRTGPGRPKLGVVSREISLLPRHWEWLEAQPNGASAALRRLVDQSRAQEEGGQRVRLAREAAGRFMTAIGGDLPGYEEACRALYAGDHERLEAELAAWPEDLRKHVLLLAWEGL